MNWIIVFAIINGLVAIALLITTHMLLWRLRGEKSISPDTYAICITILNSSVLILLFL